MTRKGNVIKVKQFRSSGGTSTCMSRRSTRSSAVRYDTRCYFNVRAQKPTRVSLIYRTERFAQLSAGLLPSVVRAGATAPAPSSNGATARRSATNAGSVTLTAELTRLITDDLCVERNCHDIRVIYDHDAIARHAFQLATLSRSEIACNTTSTETFQSQILIELQQRLLLEVSELHDRTEVSSV